MQEFAVDGRLDGAGGDRVYCDLVGREFNRQVPRQHLDSAFARAIGSKVRERKFFVHGADVDNFPWAICLPKMAHEFLRHKKHAFEVDVENGVEICFGYIPEVGAFLKAGIVDEDVDLAEGGDGLLDELLSIRHDTDVGVKGSGPPPYLGYSFDYVVRPLFVFAIADGDVGAFAGETLRDRSSNSLIAAGYGGYLTL